jgi:RecB family endonuclease NucS
MYGPAMRLIVATCEVSYRGRLTTELPRAVRLLMVKADGTFMVWADGGGPNVKPLNWMIPPTVIDEQRGVDGALELLSVRRPAGEEELEIRIDEVLSEQEHALEIADALSKEGVERELQELLAESPTSCGEGLRLVRREWATDIGPVDLMCLDTEDAWVAVEIKRIGTIDAVEQLTRYLDRIRREPEMGGCRGVLAAQQIKPQARVLAQSRGIECVVVDMQVLRGEREPDLQLFAA